MILSRFSLDDIKNIKTCEDAFRLIGIGIKEDDPQEINCRDKKIFGDSKVYYRNLVMNDTTYRAIHDRLEELSPKRPDGRYNVSGELFAWINYGPMSSGPRYEQVKELAGGRIDERVLYIITPEDSIFEESPVKVEK